MCEIIVREANCPRHDPGRESWQVSATGKLGDFREALDTPEDSGRLRLFRASMYLACLLAEKDTLNHPQERATPRLVLDGVQTALSYLRNEPLPEPTLPQPPYPTPFTKHSLEFDQVSCRSLVGLEISKVIDYIKAFRRDQAQNIVFIPLAHGALPASLLMGQAIAEATDGTTLMYPVHFSREKQHHIVPAVNEAEREYLSSLAADNAFVVFDDDTFSGLTMLQTMQYLTSACGVDRAKLRGLTAMQGGQSGAHASFKLSDEGLLSEPL